MGAVSLFFLYLSLATVYCQPHIPHEKREWPLLKAFDRQRVDADVLLPMRIGLQQNEHAARNAESWIMSVSDPHSSEYNRFWKQEDVIEAFQPSNETVEAVKNWLSRHGVGDVTHTDNKQWLAFDLPAYKAESMFQTEYYEHEVANGRHRVSCDEYYIPDELRPHIDFIKPGIKDSDITGRSKRSRVKKGINMDPDAQTILAPLQRRAGYGDYHLPHPDPSLFENDLSLCWRAVTPACLQALYNFSAPNENLPVSANNSLGIFEWGDFYSQEDLDLLFTHFTNVTKGTRPINVRIDGAPSQSNTSGHAAEWRKVTGEADLDVQIALPIIYPQNVTVFQTDDQYYTRKQTKPGFLDTFLDAIDGSFCNYSAFGQTGDSKIDPVYPDPHKNGYKGKLQCGRFLPTNVISSSWDEFEPDLPVNYQKRQCQEWLKLGLQGVSVLFDSFDEGTACGWGYPVLGLHQFTPNQAVGCPWVTAVGATMIPRNQTVNDAEIPAFEPSIGYSSGGGFSNIFGPPAYQRTAIDQYFKRSNLSIPYYYNGKYKNSTGKYNRNGRGYPDVAANGQHTAVYYRTRFSLLGGTSASTPIFASLINRIVEERIRVGKGPLGFINTALYQNPHLLNDITSGANLGCSGSKGFECEVGWDPVTGLGTPNYPKLLEFFLNLP